MAVVERLKQTLDNPALFNAFQLVIAGKQNGTRQLIREGLQLEASEYLLDVGCGTGEFANVASGPYLGIDINPKYVEYARQKYGAGGGHPEREFKVADVSSVEFAETGKKFPKAMFINSMHHLSDKQNQAVLAGIARVTTGRLVIVDMDAEPANRISRFLAEQDRGEFIRPLAQQLELVKPFFEIEKANTYYAGLTAQTLIICRVKPDLVKNLPVR